MFPLLSNRSRSSGASILSLLLLTAQQANGLEFTFEGVGDPITSCNPEDFTSASWQQHNVNLFFELFINQFDTPSNFPHFFVQQATKDFISDFDCDPNNIQSCDLSFNIPQGGTLCDLFIDPHGAFVAKSYQNIFNVLVQSHQAIGSAHNNLVNENFVANMVADVSRQKLPIPRSVLFKILGLSLNFIPIPGVGSAAAAGFKTAFKTFKKIGKKLASNGESDNEGIEKNDEAQLGEITALLDGVVPQFQAAVMDQANEIFLVPTEPATDTNPFHSPQYQMLVDGHHLDLSTTIESVTDAMTLNLKYFLTASMMTNVNLVLVQDRFPVCEPPARFTYGLCQRLLFQEDAATPLSPVTADHPNNIGNLNSYGMSLDAILDNAIDCHMKGKTAADADFDAFLGDPNAMMPECLFGIRVVGPLE